MRSMNGENSLRSSRDIALSASPGYDMQTAARDIATLGVKCHPTHPSGHTMPHGRTAPHHSSNHHSATNRISSMMR
jgi:hypothetical protein